MKVKMKKLIIICVLIILPILTTGCANIEFLRAIDASNIIIDKLVIELDESKIDKAGASMSEVLGAIDSDMVTFRNSIKDWIDDFNDYPDLYTAMLTGIKVSLSKPKSNQIALTIEFGGWDMFGLFYGYSEIDDMEECSALTKDVGPFIDKILAKDYGKENYGLFLIKYSILKNNGIVDNLETFSYGEVDYYSKYKEMLNYHYDIKDLSVSEIFAYPDDRIRSNADYSEVQGNMTLLRWDLNDKQQGFELEIFKIYPNTVSWYILALVLSALSIIIITFVIYKKSKNQIVQIITKEEVENEQR